MFTSNAALIIAGPTASGKSSLALILGEIFNGIIINADSMQVYDQLPLLTAQPSKEDQARLPHKLYGILAAHDNATAAWWREKALSEIKDAHQHNKTPILVGGTGFYFKALEEGLSAIPEIPKDIRERVRSLSVEDAHIALQQLDPMAAENLVPQDKTRIARALEVILATGQSLLSWHQKTPTQSAPYTFLKILINPPRDALKERANRRFISMIDQGALREVELFLKDPSARDYFLYKALGVRELDAYLLGELSYPDAITKACISTHQYIKRQQTWFRHQFQPHIIINEFPELFTRQTFKKVLKEIDDQLKLVINNQHETF
ncbi:MAG: tRNA (adenosine(37)-N6)-dimethylallyltransferase MiaA [Candidatus Nucleicultricaceae bacterium]